MLNVILLKHDNLISIDTDSLSCVEEEIIMSNIVYLKDILLEKSNKKNNKSGKRPKLKPFKHDIPLKSSLIEKNKKKDEKQRG